MHRYRIVNTSAILDQVFTSSNRPFGVWAQVIPTACLFADEETADTPWLSENKILSWWSASNFVPHNVLTGPLFLSIGGPGTPQAKILVRTLGNTIYTNRIPRAASWLQRHSSHLYHLQCRRPGFNSSHGRLFFLLHKSLTASHFIYLNLFQLRVI